MGYRHSPQEVCPWNVRFAEVAAERDYAAREAWEAVWDRDLDAEDVSVDAGQPLHLVWLDVLDGWLQVVTAHSADGGRSWSEPVRVSRGGREANQGNPGIAVDGQGRVAVVWNDRRHDPGERCFQPYVAVSVDGGSTFQEEIPVSDAPACPRGGRWLAGGDTQGIVGLPDGGFQLLWVGGAASPDQPYRIFSSRIGTR